jgi:hypothetical protein
MSQADRDFLNWLAGYFDHGANCNAYRTKQHGYWGLRVNFSFISKTEEPLIKIKDFFQLEKVQVREKKVKGQTKEFYLGIRSASEALLIAYQLLPYARIRKNDIQMLIDTINQWVDNQLNAKVLHGPIKTMVETVLDVRAMKATRKLDHTK